ncbi:MAG: hypothetical protein IPQ17_07295 [Xanthomonadales bacterium]|nr:hypothetical protein [Xanthomonadales bacterium]
MIPLLHANAAEMARTLTSLADDKATQVNAESPRVFADTRTNSILLAGAKNARLKLRALIAHLDTPRKRRRYPGHLPAQCQCQDLVPILQGISATLTGIARRACRSPARLAARRLRPRRPSRPTGRPIR